MFRFFVLFITIILSGCVDKSIEIVTNQATLKLSVEVADTPEELAKGLMFRENLDENKGMLFVFEKEDYVAFWMKNTKIPLDMIFVSKNGTINEIKRDLQPCKQEICETYPSKHPTKYVIEVNANYTLVKNVNVGDFVKIN